jgi:preprotein translocase subunit SecA
MESRRVDNQARGRSGRQGDEGSSIFFVSLEDDLMRIFGSESMNNILEKLGLKDGESIDHPWINKALERAQQKVEARNFDIRKTLLKFDNVLNDQRKVIFGQRNNIIGANNTFEYSDEFLNEILIKLKELKKLNLSKDKNSEYSVQIKSILGKSFEDKEVSSILELKDESFEKEIKDKFFKKRLEREEKLNKNQAQELEKRILLQLIDQNWKSHIQYLEQLRGVIGLRSYGNRDPLIEYKKEAFSLFENLLFKLKSDLITILLNLRIAEKSEEKEIKPVEIDRKYIGKKMSRNEPCFCGSGKKYKRCCGIL